MLVRVSRDCKDCAASNDSSQCTECWTNAELQGASPSSCGCSTGFTGTPTTCESVALTCDASCSNARLLVLWDVQNASPMLN